MLVGFCGVCSGPDRALEAPAVQGCPGLEFRGLKLCKIEVNVGFGGASGEGAHEFLEVGLVAEVLTFMGSRAAEVLMGLGLRTV